MSLPALALAAVLALDYRVSGGAGVLSVEGRPGPGIGTALCFDDGVGAFVSAAEAEVGGRWQAARAPGNALLLPPGATRFRYRLALDSAARRLRDKDTAFAIGATLLAPPSTWLARPCGEGLAGSRYRFRVEPDPGVTFATGVFSAGEPGTWEAPLEDLAQAPWSAFGDFQAMPIEAPGARITLAVLPGELRVSRAALRDWALSSARAVSAYYGRFPVPELLVLVVPGGRRAIGYGTTLGNGGASILIWVGAGATEADLREDWVLTHEMVHTALPNVPRTHTWLEEGIATYVEPLARVRGGTLGSGDAWRGLIEGMPRALRESGGAGLDGDRTIGGVYWGGALYCLTADVEIRERTAGRKSLQDGLRAVLDAGGSIAVTWPLQRILATADAATGTDVLQRLYLRMGEKPPRLDLQGLWRRLGVSSEAGTVRLDDRAPLAWLRKGILPDP